MPPIQSLERRQMLVARIVGEELRVTGTYEDDVIVISFDSSTDLVSVTLKWCSRRQLPTDSFF